MYKVYVYVLDTLADWELGYVTAELNSGRFFKKDAPGVTLKTVRDSKATVKTMGGLAVTPGCLIKDIAVNEHSVLLLPGANTWNDPRHGAVTAALASAGLLDSRPHTSNGPGFLEMFAPGYKGTSFYVDEQSVADGNLITAGSTGGLVWAKQIIERLGVFEAATLDAWYEYFSTGKPECFYALMQTLPSSNSAAQ